MIDRMRSLQWKRVIFVIIGIALLLIQIISTVGLSKSGDILNYGTGIWVVGNFVGYWIYAITGVLSLAYGIALKKKNRLIKGHNVVLTIALGVFAIAVTTICGYVVVARSGYNVYTLYSIGVQAIVAVFAALVCGPVSASVVCLAYPYVHFVGRFYEMVVQQEYVGLNLVQMISLFVGPCILALLTYFYSKGRTWKRLLIAFPVAIVIERLFMVLFASLRLLAVPLLAKDAPIMLSVICSVSAVAAACLAGYLFARYNKKHPLQSGTIPVHPIIMNDHEDIEDNGIPESMVTEQIIESEKRSDSKEGMLQHDEKPTHGDELSVTPDMEEQPPEKKQPDVYEVFRNAYDEIMSAISGHDELDIAPKCLDDIPAVIYTVADFVAFAENKDRRAIQEGFNEWLLADYFETGMFGDQDSLKEYVSRRIEFYGSLQHRKIAGLWLLDRNNSDFDKTIQSPIRRIVAAFVDCLIDPTYIDNYDRGELWGNLDILRSAHIAEALLMPLTNALERLALTVMRKETW